MDTETQHQLFIRAVDLLGGAGATALALNMAPRNVSRLIAGQNRLHAGILEDLCKALIAHADTCRAVERQLSPAYARNLTDAQTKPPKHSGDHAASLARRMERVLQTARQNKRLPKSWTISQTAYAKLRSDLDVSGETLFGLPLEIVKNEDLNASGFSLNASAHWDD